jgi:hypothetical protein
MLRVFLSYHTPDRTIALSLKRRNAIFRGGRFDAAKSLKPGRPLSRVVRGGSWNNNPDKLRSANRNRNTTDNRNNNLGFRVGRTLNARAGAITIPQARCCGA